MSKSYNKYIYFLPDGFPAVKDALVGWQAALGEGEGYLAGYST